MRLPSISDRFESSQQAQQQLLAAHVEDSDSDSPSCAADGAEDEELDFEDKITECFKPTFSKSETKSAALGLAPDILGLLRSEELEPDQDRLAFHDLKRDM